MSHWKPSRREFLAGSSLFAVQTAISGLPAAAAGLQSGVITKRFSFANGSAGMLPCYTDYPIGQPDYQFLAEVRPLPFYLFPPGLTRNAFYIQGDNHSDDLFMFLKANVGASDGIRGDTSYLLSFDIWFASASGGGCSGAGGSPDAVYLKAGGSTVEPVPVLIEPSGFLDINVDKGNQSTGGINLGVIGSINNGLMCPTNTYVMLHRTYNHPYPIKSTGNSGGDLWIAVGTDSGYEALTGVYYYSITVKLTPVLG
jgi:hypothetical protein